MTKIIEPVNEAELGAKKLSRRPVEKFF